jgi:hypothetical protein
MRAPSAPAALAAEVRDAARSHGALLILSDFDGTLVPPRVTPGWRPLSARSSPGSPALPPPDSESSPGAI